MPILLTLLVLLFTFLNFSATEVEARVRRDARQTPQAAIPNIDIKNACRSIVSYESSSARADKVQDLSGCVSEKQNARCELQKVWGSYSENMREQCLFLVTRPALPSYITLQTCLNTARDAVKMIEGDRVARQTNPNSSNPIDLNSLR
ncbi:MAG: hypothetical protein WBX25_24545 [Rhodomicrobium sp.]